MSLHTAAENRYAPPMSYLHLLLGAAMLIATIGNITDTFAVLTATSAMVDTAFAEELRARRCAELGALVANLEAAAAVLSREHERHGLLIAAALGEITDVIPESAACELRAGNKSYMFKAYEQENPRLPRHWPNWFIKLEARAR